MHRFLYKPLFKHMFYRKLAKEVISVELPQKHNWMNEESLNFFVGI